jgi:hypothetical protein
MYWLLVLTQVVRPWLRHLADMSLPFSSHKDIGWPSNPSLKTSFVFMTFSLFLVITYPYRASYSFFPFTASNPGKSSFSLRNRRTFSSCSAYSLRARTVASTTKRQFAARAATSSSRFFVVLGYLSTFHILPCSSFTSWYPCSLSKLRAF